MAASSRLRAPHPRLPLAIVPLVALAASATVHGRAVDPGRLRFHQPGNTVNALAEDRDGFLWVATEAGLLRHDGRGFTRVATASPALEGWIAAVAAAPDGAVWVAARDEPALFELRGQQVRRHDTKGGLVSALCVSPEGAVFAGGRNGLWRVGDDARWQGVAPGTQVSSLLALAPDEVFAATDRGLARLSRGHLDWLAEGPAFVALAFHAHSGTVFAGRARGGVVAFDRRGQASATPVEDADLSAQTLAVSRDGALWAGHRTGAVRLARAPGEAREHVPYRAIPSGSVRSLLVDRTGNVWMGTEAGGLVQLEPSPPFFSVRPDNRPLVFSVARDPEGGVAMVVGGRHLARWRAGEVASFEAPPGVFSMRAVMPNPSGFLIGTLHEGLLRFRDGQFSRITLPDGDGGGAMPLGRTRDGRSWIALGRHHLIWLGEDDETPSATIDLSRFGPGAEPVAAVEDDRGDLWFATRGAGLLRLSDKTWRQWTRADGLPSLALTHVTRGAGGTLWLGTRDAGLVSFDGDRFAAVTTAHGLKTNFVGGVIDDEHGHLWLTSSVGVHRVPEATTRTAARASSVVPLPITGFTTREGLPSNAFIWGFASAGTTDGEGRLWLPGHRGALVFPKPDTAAPAAVPSIVLESASLDGVPLDLQDLTTRRHRVGDGNLEFRWGLPMFHQRDRVRFRYRLIGHESSWHEAGDRQEASYGNIAAGDYGFEVVAYAVSGTQDSDRSVAHVALSLVPPFHRSRSFLVLMALAVAATTTWFLHLRAQLLRRRFQLVTDERNRIAREIHDSLEQTLFAARFRLDAAEQELPERPLTESTAFRQHIEELRRLLDQSLDETRAAVWSLRTGIFGRADFASAVSLMANTALQGTRIVFEQTLVGKPFTLPAVIEWHLGRVVREAITNALKHANPERLNVRIDYGQDDLAVDVEDDGQGLPQATSPDDSDGHYGLRGMRERLRSFNGRLEIDSKPGRGTRLRVIVPRRQKGDL